MTSAKLSFTTYYEITEIHILIQVELIKHFFHHNYEFATDAGIPFTCFLGLQAFENTTFESESKKQIVTPMALRWYGNEHNFVLIATIH